MRFISHRGNIDGKRVALENSEVYIKKALDKGYDVEIDVWYLDHSFWLGHDTPKDAVSETFLKHPNLWIHAKNIAALYHLKDGPNNVFFHNNDEAVLTSKNVIWTYAGVEPLTPASVAVILDGSEYTLEQLDFCYGICSDTIALYRRFYG